MLYIQINKTTVTAYNRQRDFKPMHSSNKLYCVQGVYKLITIIEILNMFVYLQYNVLR